MLLCQRAAFLEHRRVLPTTTTGRKPYHELTHIVSNLSPLPKPWSLSCTHLQVMESKVLMYPSAVNGHLICF